MILFPKDNFLNGVIITNIKFGVPGGPRFYCFVKKSVFKRTISPNTNFVELASSLADT